MSLDIPMITFDYSDPDALAAWWNDAVDGEVNTVAPGELVMVAAGATELGCNSFGPDFEWVVLADLEGNAFCMAGG